MSSPTNAARAYRDWAAEVLTDESHLGALEAQFDGAIIDGMLEDQRWDRWLLQRVHRVLRMDARVIVIVPPLASIASAADLRFWAYISRQALRRLLPRWSLVFERPGSARRRYRLQSLVRKMETVGYTSIDPGPEWSARGPGPRAWLAGRASVTARKGPTFPALHRAQGAVPAQAARLSRFDTSQGGAARVLVLSPHPDDELIGCGGTLCRLLSSGARACVVQATDGRGLESLRDLPEARRRSVRIEEAARVAAELGVELVAWGEEDGRLEPCSRTIGRLARLLAALRPTHIFTPFLDDRHPDHRALSRMLQAALALAPGELRVLQYEVWGRVRANTYCEVTNAMETVGRLLLLYERAMRVEDYVRMCEQRNLTNGLRLTGKPAYAEGFLCTSGAAFIELGRCVA